MTDKVIVFTACGTEAEAKSLARLLVERRLAACVSVVAPVQSIYRWENKIQESSEWLLMIKSRQDRFLALSAAIREAHSYEVPEILQVPVADGSAAYLAWLDAETNE